MIRVLITRTQPDAARTATAVCDLGFAAIVAPMLAIGPFPAAPPANAKGLIFTSRAGVAHTLTSKAIRSLPVWVVGAATADAARAAGWTQIYSADGDGAALAALIGAHAPIGPLAWMSGEVAAFDLVSALAQHRIPVIRRIVYTTVATHQPPPLADIAMFHSARAAIVFGALAAAPLWAKSTAIALSDNVAEPLKDFGFQRVEIAEAATETALINTLAQRRP